MDFYTISIPIVILTTIIFFTKKFLSTSKSKLPPGPKPWPIIGNIHQLGNKPHRSVTKLSKIYGSIMSLKLGSITTIVISSSDVAKEMFLKHDLVFSGRSVPIATMAINHANYSITWLPVCPKWRDLRKVATIQLFTNKRLSVTQALRQNKVQELVTYARQCYETNAPIDIGKAVFTTTLNLLSNTLFSIDLASHESAKAQEFNDLVSLLTIEGGRPNVSDFFPIVKDLDLQGIFKRTTHYLKKIVEIIDEIIDGRLKTKRDDDKDDVLSTLIRLVEDKELSLDDVRHLVLDMFLAGPETTSSTLEWAMTELLCNPDKMAKAQSELSQIIGRNETIQESDISKLHYIQAIVKESLRLHPPTPFLIPHKAEKEVQFCGYTIPKNAQVWVNLWSIGRDPNIWVKPETFTPERFLEQDIDVKGQDFELIPFGAGRRICPGLPLAHRMVHLVLATLLHSFNWKCDGEIDMEEKFGIALQKTKPLQVIPLPR